MANSGPYGGGYQSYAGYGSDIVPPPATPNPRDAADCAFKRPKYPGWLCPLHVDSSRPVSANSGIRQGAKNDSERPFVDICRSARSRHGLTLLPRP